MQYTTQIIKTSLVPTTPIIEPPPELTQRVIEQITNCGIKINPSTTKSYYAVAHQIAFNVFNPTRAKGICLSGTIGAGKTLLMKFLSAYTKCELFSLRELAHQWTSTCNSTCEPLNNLLSPYSVIMDDLGAEGSVKAYGNEFPIEMILDKRSTWFDDYRVLTHFTTNFADNFELQDEYGEVVTSRILGMCEFISLTGDDWRRK